MPRAKVQAIEDDDLLGTPQFQEKENVRVRKSPTPTSSGKARKAKAEPNVPPREDEHAEESDVPRPAPAKKARRTVAKPKIPSSIAPPPAATVGQSGDVDDRLRVLAQEVEDTLASLQCERSHSDAEKDLAALIASVCEKDKGEP